MFSVKRVENLPQVNSPLQKVRHSQKRQDVNWRFRQQCHWYSAASRRHYQYRLLEPKEKLNRLRWLFPLQSHVQRKRRVYSARRTKRFHRPKHLQ